MVLKTFLATPNLVMFGFAVETIRVTAQLLFLIQIGKVSHAAMEGKLRSNLLISKGIRGKVTEKQKLLTKLLYSKELGLKVRHGAKSYKSLSVNTANRQVMTTDRGGSAKSCQR